jgi:small subunit ribosomal protein S14
MTTAKRVKDAKIEKKFELARDKKEKTPKFGLCRLCFRGLALRGEIPGVSKSSW